MVKTAQNIIFPILFAICYLLFAASSSFAQTTGPKQDLPAGRQDLHNYTQTVMIEVTSSLGCMLAGIDLVNPNQKCLGIANGKIGPVDSSGGAIGVVGNLIAMTFTPPIHTSDYVNYLASNFGVAKPAYAQGVGFEGLSPLVPIWTAFRNITYLLFVLIFIVIGFAIMLRVRIDPRTVMTIENQIPRIIISLILVTFSFAIAGFLIDLMYVSIYLVANVFASIPGTNINTAITQATNPLEAGNSLAEGLGGFTKIASDGAGSVAPFFSPIVDNDLGRLLMAGILTLIEKFGLADVVANMVRAISVALAAPTAGASVPTGVGASIIVTWIAPLLAGAVGFAFAPQIAYGLGWILAFIVFLIAIIWALIRVWFALLKAYVMILIDVVFAPFWILLGGVPGSRLSFETWLRDIGSNLLAFPATIVMFLLAKTFIDLFGAHGGTIFTPPLIGNPAGTAIGSLVGLGIILLTPSVVDMMRKALKAPDFDLSAIGAAVGVGTGAVNPINIIGRSTQFGSTLYWAHQTPVLGGILERMGIRQPGGARGGPAPH